MCKIYGVKQSTTTPYNPHGNSPCKRLNYMLQNLLKILPKDQNPNWQGHLGALVFAYNAMLHSTTGYQPYQLMFGYKAQTPCNNWLGFSQYNCSESVQKKLWIQQQYELVQVARKQALRSIRAHKRAPKDWIKSCLKFQRETWFCCMATCRVAIKSKTDIKMRSLWWLARIQSQMFTALSQSMAMALSGQSIDNNFKILEEPKMMENLPLLRIIRMGHKFPLLTENQL